LRAANGDRVDCLNGEPADSIAISKPPLLNDANTPSSPPSASLSRLKSSI
jgi:hypothetical protein